MKDDREYWMVDYGNGVCEWWFHFCETEAEARARVKEYQRLGYTSRCWKL